MYIKLYCPKGKIYIKIFVSKVALMLIFNSKGLLDSNKYKYVYLFMVIYKHETRNSHIKHVLKKFFFKY